MYAVHTVAYCFLKKMNARLRVHFKILVILLVHVERVERYILMYPVVWNNVGKLGKHLLTPRHVKHKHIVCSSRCTPLACCDKNASESYMHMRTILGGVTLCLWALLTCTCALEEERTTAHLSRGCAFPPTHHRVRVPQVKKRPMYGDWDRFWSLGSLRALR